MSRLNVQAIAKAQSLNLSQLQIKAGVSMGTVRRYWYGTKNGKEVGEKLTEIDLAILDKFAQALNVPTTRLIEEDWPALHLAAAWKTITRWRAVQPLGGVSHHVSCG